MYPDIEVHDLILTACICELMAEQGEKDKAHNRLQDGLDEAREMKSQGCPWSAELVRLWEVAVTDFRRRHLSQGIRH
jgi:hypothetical protein